jgi:hypothetical protein
MPKFLMAAVAFLALIGQAWALGGETDPTYVFNQGLGSGAITPSDSTVLNPMTRALYIGNATACNIAVKLQNDSAAVTFLNVQVGQILPFRVKAVMATNTTCTNTIAIY